VAAPVASLRGFPECRTGASLCGSLFIPWRPHRFEVQSAEGSYAA
jgi:hypothetical protein